MIQLFKYLKDAGWTVGLIVLLLIVQAWCDLSLPTYTSDIVDVGIQQGGIAYAVPYRMRGETLRELEAYMTPDQIAVLEGAYTKRPTAATPWRIGAPRSSSGWRAFWKSPFWRCPGSRHQRNIRPGAAGAGPFRRAGPGLGPGTSGGAAPGDRDPEPAENGALCAAGVPGLGHGPGRPSDPYLLATGGRMLALSLVMVAAAILTGLLASRAAARIGMNLRRRVC